MWTVKSEAGKLRKVLVQEGFYSLKLDIPNLSSSYKFYQQYEKSREQHKIIYKFLRDENIKVFELGSVIKKILDESSIEDKKEIIETMWGPRKIKPNPDELSYEHLIYAYPLYPYYNDELDKIVLPETDLRTDIYQRDITFTTQIGLVLSNMNSHRSERPLLNKLAYERHPEFQDNIKIIWNSTEHFKNEKNGGIIEGGDVLILDDETILVGIGQRTNINGFLDFVRNIFAKDNANQIKYICAIKLPRKNAKYSHLDTFINFPDKNKILITPYFFESELSKKMPKRNLLIKMVGAKREWLEEKSRPLENILRKGDFVDSGECDIWMKGNNNKPDRVGREKNFIDFLIKEGKVDRDQLILVGGEPKNDNDVNHLLKSLQEHGRSAANIVAIKPGLVIGFERNEETVRNLEEYGVEVRKLPDAYIIGRGAGPHCMTCPLDRDSI